MMMPRVYLFTSPEPSSPPEKPKEQREMVARSKEKAHKAMVIKDPSTGARKPAKISSPPPASPSKPVVIPARPGIGGQRRNKNQISKIKTIPEDGDILHDSRSIAPCTTAFVATTSLPNSRRASDSQPRSYRRGFIDGNGMLMDLEASRIALSLSSPQPWGVLLSPPSDSFQDTVSINSDSTLDQLYSIASVSSESIPSLEADVESSSSIGNLSTPPIPTTRWSSSNRRIKTLSSFASEDCMSDHPLLSELPQMIPDFDTPYIEPLKGEIRLLTNSKAVLRSNLSASIRILKTAATSFSTSTAPARERDDDYLTRSLLSVSPQFTDERRPTPSATVPDPVLRRYLNPFTVSPAELHFHHNHHSGAKCTASIQLQTYKKTPRSSRKASAPPVFASHPLTRSPAELLTVSSSSRQREPRENSDFLRVIVLEMNMRKVGKLSHASPGRAKLWLPARQGASHTEVEEIGVPRRWAGTSS